MTIARIVERFTMQIEAQPERGEWFLDYVLRSPKQASRHLTAGWLALQSIHEPYAASEIQSCREYFGGMGAQALMVHLLFPQLENHLVYEFSQEAVAHLKLQMPETVEVRGGNSYIARNTQPADLIVLDFGDLTVWKTRDGEKHRELLDRVFLLEPKAVVFTDIACRYLHLQRERYETLLGPGTCESYETYLYALLRRIQNLYGYVLYTGFWDRWSAVMTLIPQGQAPMGRLEPTPDSPIGLELL